jgi:hypothetical protein
VFREAVSRVEPLVLEADAEAEVSSLLLFVPSQLVPPWGSGDDVAFKEDVAFEKGVSRILDAEVD